MIPEPKLEEGMADGGGEKKKSNSSHMERRRDWACRRTFTLTTAGATLSEARTRAVRRLASID
jgi:hypothetical protein